MAKTTQGQDLFDFDAVDTPAPPVKARVAPMSRPSTSWNWWDPWPDGLTTRAYMVLQIKRDMRALEETGDPFYAERLVAYRADLI